jgi:hypothetical protein
LFSTPCQQPAVRRCKAITKEGRVLTQGLAALTPRVRLFKGKWNEGFGAETRIHLHYFKRIAGSPNKIHVRRTSESVVACFALSAA